MLYILFLIAIATYGAILLFTWNKNQTKKLVKNLKDPSIELPSGTYVFPLGETLMYTDYGRWFREYGARYREWGLFLYFLVYQPVYYLIKAEYIKDLMSKPEEAFHRRFPFDFLKEAFGESLLGVSGEVWKKQHRIIQKAFTTANVPLFFPLFIQTTLRRFEEVKKAAETNTPVDMNKIFNEIGAEAIIKAAFGVEGKQAEALTEAIQAFLHSQTTFLRIPGMTKLTFIPQVKKYRETLDFICSEADKIVEERRAILKKEKETGETSSISNYTLVDLLLNAVDDESGAQLSDRELKDNCRTFLGAGSETSATTMSWLIYHLTKYPEIYEKVKKEVDQVVPDDISTFSYQHLAKLEYLPLVLNESMRVKPAVGVLTLRIPIDDLTVGEWLFPKGSCLTFSIPMVHNSPDNYEDPDKFIPERWEDGQDKKRPYSFTPFGAGRRVCIGRYFGLLEVKVVCALFIKLFDFKRVPHPDGTQNHDEIQISYHTPVLHLKGGLPLMVSKRTPTA